jgi:riboflavin-specific deaminase-like protein
VSRPGDVALSRIVPRYGASPFVVAQLGQSLDGRIATPSGESRGLGGAPSIDHLHALRARVEAVLVGIGTVLADDPQLNVRRCAGANPARVVLDARGKVSPHARCLNGEDGARRIVFRAPEHATALGAGVETVVLAAPEGRFDLAEVLRALSARGIGSVLIEGGACIVSRAIELGLVDRLHLMVSPVILGAGRTGLEFAALSCLGDARRPRTDVIPLGQGDVLFDCELKP